MTAFAWIESSGWRAFDLAFGVDPVPISVGYIEFLRLFLLFASSENSGGRSLMTTRIARASKVL